MCRRSSYRSRACPSSSSPLCSVSLLSEDQLLQTCDLLSSHSLPPYFHLLQNRCLALLVLRNHERTQDLLRQQFARFSMLSSSSHVFAFPPGRGLVFISLSNSWLSLLRFSPFKVAAPVRRPSSQIAASHPTIWS